MPKRKSNPLFDVPRPDVVKKEHKSTVPEEHKIIKKKREGEEKKNHYVKKSFVTEKLIAYRELYFIIVAKRKASEDSESDEKQLKIMKDELIFIYEKVCKKLINSYKFYKQPFQVKEDMVSYSILQMYRYGYFYKFDSSRSAEGFSWMTSVCYNFFLQELNDSRNHLSLRKEMREQKIDEFENTNSPISFDLIAEASLVKGIRYSYEDMAADD